MNCIIVHGCPSTEAEAKEGTYNKHWMPWLRAELLKKGIPTDTPQMPAPWAPHFKAYTKAFDSSKITEETVLVGHSCGCAFLVRWLGETKKKVAKLILVAPWKIGEPGDVGREEFYGFAIDPTIKDRVNEIIYFTADDEEDDGKTSLRMFHDVLEGTIIELKGRGHYTRGQMGTEEFAELLEIVTK